MNSHHVHTIAGTIQNQHIPQALLGLVICLIVLGVLRALVKALFRGLGGGSR